MDAGEILDFIKEHQLATICVSADDMPYCFNAFYSLMEKENYLVIKSAYGTRHMEMAEKNDKVAGTIIPDQVNPSLIRGIQFSGRAVTDNMALALQAAASYYLRFPLSMAIPGKIWMVELTDIKFTDYTKGLNYKATWQRSEK